MAGTLENFSNDDVVRSIKMNEKLSYEKKLLEEEVDALRMEID